MLLETLFLGIALWPRWAKIVIVALSSPYVMVTVCNCGPVKKFLRHFAFLTRDVLKKQRDRFVIVVTFLCGVVCGGGVGGGFEW
ncbi:hypothetical protein [Thalassoglobus sp.]|uniref:hypothetical protein n=1 Tax=Thalassoglobus sp. TaxID=2795869 RepID=UPI003AA9000B